MFFDCWTRTDTYYTGTLVRKYACTNVYNGRVYISLYISLIYGVITRDVQGSCECIDPCWWIIITGS